MKKNIIRLSALLLAAAPLAACDDWTEPEAQDFTQRFPESYYENLRAYKASDHSITFGWFGGCGMNLPLTAWPTRHAA